MPTLDETIRGAASTYSRLELAAKAVALQDHQRLLRDHAMRVRDSHNAMAKAAGFATDNRTDEPMGDILIGDTHFFAGQAPAAPSSAAAAPQGTGAADWLKKAAIATALLGAGGGAGVVVPWALGLFGKTPPATTGAGLELPGGYELRIVPEENEPK